jgi:peptidoglycan/xylan/chitin deacetylase (PgdA/CDA1 family)
MMTSKALLKKSAAPARAMKATKMVANLVYLTKLALGLAMGLTMVDRALLAIQRKVFSKGYIRIIFYHSTPESSVHNLEKQLRYYQRYFSPVSLSDLDNFIDYKEWAKAKPGLLISFDDGCKTNYDVAKPLLEKYGFTGWFFVPTGFINTPVAEQKQFAARHNLHCSRGCNGRRIAMSWQELKELDKNHVIGCHTRNHYRMDVLTPAEKLEEEIVRAKHTLEEKLQHKVAVFSWVGGEEHTYSPAAARCIRQAGYRYAFMTNCAPILTSSDRFHLQRTIVESGWHFGVIRFQLSGLMDIIRARIRNRVNRVTAT